VQAVKQGTSDSKEACWAQFVLQCRNNLHVVLAMSPVGETLRTRCRNFPGLVNNTFIDWFEPWPEQALHSVATVFLQASSPVCHWPPLQGILALLKHLSPHVAVHTYTLTACFGAVDLHFVHFECCQASLQAFQHSV